MSRGGVAGCVACLSGQGFFLAAVVALAGSLTTMTTAALAKDEPGTTFSSDLSEVLMGGNSSANTLGFKASFLWVGARAALTAKTGGLRTRATSFERTAVATGPGTVRLDEESLTATSAESFFANVRFDRRVTERFSWNAGSGWERDRFAGIDRRLVTFAGGGVTLVSQPSTDFKVSLAATYTQQREIIPNPLTPDDSFGGRLGWAFRQKLGANTTVRQELLLDEDLQLARDVRLDALTELEVGMSRHLALKTGLRLRYDNLPALKELSVVDTLGQPTGDRYTVSLRKLDSTFTVAFVLNLQRKRAPVSAAPAAPAGPPPAAPAPVAP